VSIEQHIKAHAGRPRSGEVTGKGRLRANDEGISSRLPSALGSEAAPASPRSRPDPERSRSAAFTPHMKKAKGRTAIIA